MNPLGLRPKVLDEFEADEAKREWIKAWLANDDNVDSFRHVIESAISGQPIEEAIDNEHFEDTQ